MLGRILTIPAKVLHIGLQIPAWIARLPALFLNILERNVVGDSYAHIDELLAESMENKNHLAIKKVGCLGHHVAAFSPSSTAEMASMLNQLDAQKNGRKGYSGLNSCSNGIFLLAKTGDEAKQHREQLNHQLVSFEKYAQLSVETTLDVLGKGRSGDPKTIIQLIVRTILAKGLLGLSSLSPEMNQTMNEIESHVFRKSGRLMPNLFYLDEDFRKARAHYAQLPADTIHLVAGENLINVTGELLHLINSAIELDDDFFESMAEQALEIFQGNEIDFKKLMEKESILQDAWVASLTNNRYTNDTGLQYIIRYAEIGLELKNGSKIPPKTMLNIRLPDPAIEVKESSGYSPNLDPAFFSAGYRKCPGAKVAEVIFKAVVATLVAFYEIEFSKDKVSFAKRFFFPSFPRRCTSIR